LKLSIENENSINDRQRARDKAARFLSYRARSREEVRRKLSEQGFDEAVIDNTVEWLEELGYINDAKFCEMYAYHARKHNGFGNERVERELKRLGVPAEVIDGFFDGDLDKTDETDEAEKLLRKRFKRAELPDEGDKEAFYKERKRSVDFLLRKGYGFEVAETAWKRLRDSEG
jgi:regulatory protein